MNAGDQIERLSRILGRAAIAAWSDLPQQVQHDLFERAVALGHRGEFLHDHHKRTAGT